GAVIERCVIHVTDILTEPDSEFGGSKAVAGRAGFRTMLAAPMLREGVAIGAILVHRTEVRPFTPKQIELLETFADQAAIAIENARLFNELQSRNRDLTEALEQQTATSEILGVIASSPTELQPVLDAIAKSAAQVCSAEDATIRLVERNVLRPVAHQGSIPAFQGSELPIDRGSITGRAVVDLQLIHIDDVMALDATEFDKARAVAEQDGVRTLLATPLQREGVPIGAILIRRTEVCPF